MGAPKVDMINKRYGKLVVLSEAGKEYNGYKYLCRCDCGNEKVILGASLRKGITTSCGCNCRKVNTAVKSDIGRPYFKLVRMADDGTEAVISDYIATYLSAKKKLDLIVQFEYEQGVPVTYAIIYISKGKECGRILYHYAALWVTPTLSHESYRGTMYNEKYSLLKAFKRSVPVAEWAYITLSWKSIGEDGRKLDNFLKFSRTDSCIKLKDIQALLQSKVVENITELVVYFLDKHQDVIMQIHNVCKFDSGSPYFVLDAALQGTGVHNLFPFILYKQLCN